MNKVPSFCFFILSVNRGHKMIKNDFFSLFIFYTDIIRSYTENHFVSHCQSNFQFLLILFFFFTMKFFFYFYFLSFHFFSFLSCLHFLSFLWFYLILLCFLLFLVIYYLFFSFLIFSSLFYDVLEKHISSVWFERK